MSERNRKIFVFGILIVTSIWGYFSITGRQAERAAKKARQAASSSPAPMEAVADVEQIFLAEKLVEEYKSRPWGVDPFYHAYTPRTGSKVSEEVTLHLLGILYREMNARALINGQILKEGDFFEGYEVIKITPDIVHLQSNQKKITLRVKKESS